MKLSETEVTSRTNGVGIPVAFTSNDDINKMTQPRFDSSGCSPSTYEVPWHTGQRRSLHCGRLRWLTVGSEGHGFFSTHSHVDRGSFQLPNMYSLKFLPGQLVEISVLLDCLRVRHQRIAVHESRIKIYVASNSNTIAVRSLELR